MQKEELFIEAHKTTDKEFRGKLLGEVYTANLRLIIEITSEYTRNPDRFEDLLQIAYIALDNACRYYKPESKYPPISYFRMCIKHEYFKDWCKIHSNNEFVTEKVVDLDYTNIEFTEVAERRMMRELLWQTVNQELPDRCAITVRKRYKHADSLLKIGQSFGITQQGVSSILNKSMKILRQSEKIIEIGQYFGYYKEE